MPPPWSFLPLIALKDTLASTSLYFVSSTTQMLKTDAGDSAVWASTCPDFDGAVASATTFQTLASSLLPVWAAFQPLGTLPTASLPKRKTRSLSSAASRVEPSSNRARVVVLYQCMFNLLNEKQGSVTA